MKVYIRELFEQLLEVLKQVKIGNPLERGGVPFLFKQVFVYYLMQQYLMKRAGEMFIQHVKEMLNIK